MRGLVNEIVPGTVNSSEVVVRVNGALAEVSKRSFYLDAFPLALGPNELDLRADRDPLPAAVDSVTTRDYHGLAMHAVGIKDLKAKLSEYVRAARAGETVLITDRGEVVAALGPSSERVSEIQPDSVEARLAELARKGQVTRARLPKKGWTWRPQGLGMSRQEVEALLDDLRADRFEP